MIELSFVYLVGIVMGVTEVFKRTGLSTRYVPLVSLVLGMVGGYFFFGHSVEAITSGIVAGLTSSGVWSGVKTVANK